MSRATGRGVATAGPIRFFAALVLALGPWIGFPVSGHAAPSEATDPIDFYVHQCLVDADGLPHYQALVDARLEEAAGLLQGEHGPYDSGCCVRIEAASVQAFGSCGDGFNHVNTGAEVAALFASAPGAYLVDTVHFCGGVASTGIRGCAEQPGDVMIVGREADDSFFLDEVIAHERGHNAGLAHVSSNQCELMRDSSGGGCVTSVECGAFAAQASGTGGVCSCLPDVFGDPPLPPGTACVEEGGFEVCAGGTCEGPAAGAHLHLWIAGGPGAATGVATDTRLLQDMRHGDWVPMGGFGGGVELSGLAYDRNRKRFFGIERRPGNERLLVLDKTTGLLIGLVPLPFDGIEAVAYDARSDFIYAAQVDSEIFGSPFSCSGAATCITEILRIDPVTFAATPIGELNTYIVPDGVTGMAFDSARSLIYVASEAGLAQIDPEDCDGVTCVVTLIDTEFRNPVTLAYDSWRDQLIRQGSVLGRTVIDRIDLATGGRLSQTRLDPFTPGGSTIVPLPEPAALAWGALLVVALGRRRRPRQARFR